MKNKLARDTLAFYQIISFLFLILHFVKVLKYIQTFWWPRRQDSLLLEDLE
jgi:hypothetical protein